MSTLLVGLVCLVVGAVGGWVASYLVLRNNPKVKGKVDGVVGGVETIIKNR